MFHQPPETPDTGKPVYFLSETPRVSHNHPNVCHFESPTDPPIKKEVSALDVNRSQPFVHLFFPGKMIQTSESA